MMRKIRQLHLWIGLLTSFLILIEAGTGLLMAEPWLMGLNKPSLEQGVEFEKTKMAEDSQQEDIVGGQFKNKNQGNSLPGFVKNLHAGRIGDTDVSLLLDIVAIGLIFLTITGIILSIKSLKASAR